MTYIFIHGLGQDSSSWNKTLSYIDDIEKKEKAISLDLSIFLREKDTVNKNAAKGLAENITKAEIKFIKKAGHEVNKEAPLKLAEVINGFYRR